MKQKLSFFFCSSVGRKKLDRSKYNTKRRMITQVSYYNCNFVLFYPKQRLKYINQNMRIHRIFQISVTNLRRRRSFKNRFLYYTLRNCRWFQRICCVRALICLHFEIMLGVRKRVQFIIDEITQPCR